MPSEDLLRAASALSAGVAYIPSSRLGIKRLIFAPARSGRVLPIQLATLCFKRRAPGPALIEVLVAATMSGLTPALFILISFAACAILFILLFGNAATTLRVAGLAGLTCWISMIVHEAAHLITLRIVERDRTIGAFCHSWANVWVVAPRISTPRRRIVAILGPVAGAATCGLAAIGGTPGWLCAAVAAIHLVNLLPNAPDGRAVFDS